MKTSNKRNLLLSALALLLVLGSTSQTWAHPDGYWDGRGHWVPYGYYHHHNGYWDHRNGGRIWINIG